MKNYFRIAIACTIILFFAGCKEAYDLPDTAKNLNLLVVEGLLNSGPGQTIIRLSRTVNIKDTTKIKPELKATVTVEGENGNIFSLIGNTKGEYTNGLLLDNNIKYRLRIKTFAGKEYLSDFVPVQKSPPIDSVTWQRRENVLEPGIQVYVNTHDPQNKTTYYRWEYDETWEFHSPYFSNFEYRNDSVVPRPDPIKLLICWKSELSNRILLGSSAKLDRDVISLAPVTVIPFASIKISVRYSINVKQYALTKEAYEYWDILKKNTEQIGTLFDPQPSNLISNIHCLTTPDEEVIGYISAGSITEKRLFILRNEVDPWNYFHGCPDEMPITPREYKSFFGNKILIPTRENFNMFGILIGYYGGPPGCVDCTTIGTNVKPSFW